MDTRFALVPNADLGHAQASLDATLDLCICRLFLLAAVLRGDVFVFVVVGEIRAEEMLVRTIVFCNKVKRFGLLGEERRFNRLASRVRNRSRHEACELAGVVRVVAVQLALVDGAGQVLEDEPHCRVRPERHADAEAVVEHACNQRTFFRDACFFFDDAGERQHAVPVAQRFPHGALAVLHLVTDLEVGGDHLSQYGLLVGVDSERIRVRQEVAFERVAFDAESVGELRVLDQLVPAGGVEVRETLLQIGGDFPGGPTFGDGHLADGALAAFEQRGEFFERLVGGDLVPAGFECRFFHFTPQREGQFVGPNVFFL